MTRRYRPHGEGSATGAQEHALALESAWSRNAYGARHTEDLYEVMRSVENRLGTITSLRWTEDGAWVLLRTSRVQSKFNGLPYLSSVDAEAARSSPRNNDALQTTSYPAATLHAKRTTN